MPAPVNEARVGYNRLYQPTLPADLNTPASAYGLDTGVTGPNTGGLPRIGFGGYFPTLGGFKWPKFQGPDSITQFVDHISYTVGKHALKFGGELHYNKVQNASYGNARGSVTFLGGVANAAIPAPNGSSPLEDFFAGAPFKSTVEVGNPTLHLHNWAYSGFFQDDWRITKNLTINFGVRYEYSSVPQEANNLLGNFDPTLGMVQVGHQISSLYNPDHKNFGPRAGFAWDIGGNGRTVLRGGGGLIYETVNWQSFVAFNNAFGPGSVPTGAPIDAAGDTSGGTITTSNVTVKNFLNYPTHLGCCKRAALRQQHGQLLQQPVPHHDGGPQPHDALRVELDVEPAACLHGESVAGSRLRRQPRIESDWNSGHQPAACGQ